MNHCRVCGQDFGSLGAFDNHRVGKHAYTFAEGLRFEPSKEDGRRCLDADELRAKDWKQDRYGRWRRPGNASLRFTQRAGRAAGGRDES